jgi:steroid delta-isomerase
MNALFELVQAALNASAGKDRASWLAVWDDDAVIEDPVGTAGFELAGFRCEGIEAITRLWDDVFSVNAGLRYKIERHYPGGDEMALSIRFEIIRDSGVFVLHALNVYKRSANGKLASMRSFWEEGGPVN